MRRRIAVASIIAAAVAVQVMASCITPQWYEKTPPDAGNPYGALIVRTADLNGDGKPEMVAMSTGGVSWATILPDNTFSATQIVIGNQRNLNSLLLGDFNNDAKVDVLVSDRDAKTLIVIPGNGDGTFAAPVTSSVPEFPHVLASGDFDGDGKLDAVVATNDIAKVIIYKGDGAGHFAEASRSDVDPASLRVAVGDLDGDGVLDIVVTHEFSSVIDILFGNGNASFTPALKITGRNYAATAAVADLDGDGDLDLVFGNASDHTLSVQTNFGGRTFGPPATFRAYPLSGPTWSDPYDMVVLDVTGDGRLDVVMSTTGGFIVTYDGNGVGGFADPISTGVYYLYRATLAVTDVNADSRPDLVLAKFSSYVVTMLNRCGDSRVTLTSSPPMVSVGQAFTAVATVSGASTNSGSRIATGEVKLRSGDTILATGQLANGSVTFNVNDAPPADHQLVAWYAGDLEYTPNKSTEVLQRVTTATTSTTVTTVKTEYEYGESLPITATATCSEGDTPVGYFYFTTDGVEGVSYYGNNVSTATYYPSSALPIGTHTFKARYKGNTTHPPSPPSPPIDVTVTKATPAMSLYSATWVATTADTVVYEVRIESKNYGTAPTGTVTLYDGSTQLQTMTFPSPTSSYLARFEVTGLAVGTHPLHADYGGDSRYKATAGPLMQTMIYPAGSQSFDARGEAGGVRVYWLGPSYGQFVYRSTSPFTSWSYAGYYYPGSLDSGATTGTVYLYRLEYWDSSSSTSRKVYDLAQVISFTDDPLTAGITIKAVHMTEIVAALNRVRSAAGLPAIALDIAAGQLIKAQDIIALRDSIIEARQKLGVSPAPFTNTVVPGAPIRAVDIQELREAVR